MLVPVVQLRNASHPAFTAKPYRSASTVILAWPPWGSLPIGVQRDGIWTSGPTWSHPLGMDLAFVMPNRPCSGMLEHAILTRLRFHGTVDRRIPPTYFHILRGGQPDLFFVVAPTLMSTLWF